MGDEGSNLRFCLLGPVRAWRAGEELTLGPAKQQTVLVTLLLERNRPVSLYTIIDAVWGEAPPQDARNTVQTYVSRLRRALWPTEPGEVLVSNTVKDLVVGSDLAFEDRGAHHLKGIEGEWQVLAVRQAA